MGEALPRQDDDLADRCALAVILAGARGANFPRKGSKNFTQYFSERPELTTQLRGLKEGQQQQNLNRKNNNYEDKVNESDNELPGLRLRVAVFGCCNGAEYTGYLAGGSRPSLQRGHAKGLVPMDLR